MKNLKEIMNEKLAELSDLSECKVGDIIWTIESGEDEIKDTGFIDKYPIRTLSDYSYTLDGKYHIEYSYPSAFLKNPFENIGNNFEERWMLVSDNEIEWKKRKVFMFKNKSYFSWANAETDEDVLTTTSIVRWKHAKEIEIPIITELTLEEIAVKFNIKVENLKIIEKFAKTV